MPIALAHVCFEGEERKWRELAAMSLSDPKRSFDGVSFQCLAVDGLGKAMNSISCRSFVDTKDESVRVLAVLLISLASAYSAAANAQISDTLVRIGVLGDLSGVYADFGGPGDVVAARMAVEDFGGKVLGKPIDVVALRIAGASEQGEAARFPRRSIP